MSGAIGTRLGAAALLSAALLAGCSGYDAGYDCEQAIACAAESGSADTVSQKECEESSQGYYESLSGDEQDRWDEIFSGCSEQKSCAYVRCVQEKAG